MKLTYKKNTGFTLVELMVATTLATLMSFGVLAIYVNQSVNISTETKRDTTSQEAQRAFDIISRLLRQAQQSSINITYDTGQIVTAGDPPETINDAITIDFTLPPNQDIWPNVRNAANPVNNNAVRLRWHNNGGDYSHQIQISNTTSVGALDAAPISVLAGDDDNSQSRIINMDFWPLLDQRTLQGELTGTANSGYLLRITTRAATADMNYVNPDVNSGDYINYRTYTVSGVITPRNP